MYASIKVTQQPVIVFSLEEAPLTYKCTVIHARLT